LSKSDGKHPSEVGGMFQEQGATINIIVAMGMCFLLDRGAMWQRLQRWWGNFKKFWYLR